MRKYSMKASVMVAMAIIPLMTATMVQAESCSVSNERITNTGNRGAHFDVKGGMRHGGYTVLYPSQKETTFKNFGKSPKSFEPGYKVTFKGTKQENGLCVPSKTTVTKG
jgi:hypothetical protein